MHTLCPLPVGRTQTVSAGITAADDHDMLVFGTDKFIGRDIVTLADLILQRQIFHRLMDAL